MVAYVLQSDDDMYYDVEDCMTPHLAQAKVFIHRYKAIRTAHQMLCEDPSSTIRVVEIKLPDHGRRNLWKQ